jgi:hypothetical protein
MSEKGIAEEVWNTIPERDQLIAERNLWKREAQGFQSERDELAKLLRYWRPLIREALGLNPEERATFDRLIGKETKCRRKAVS